ncbi:MAG: DNA polymerase III subunit delta [Elusimicrobiales bacterium]|nr:DNA polymerase III subunit delta [Elusimicrobiales bacterium]
MSELSREEVLKEWKAGKTRPVYYLYGEENTSKEHLIKNIIPLFKPEGFNYSLRLAQSCDMSAFLDEANTVPMLANVRFLVLKDANELKKADLDILINYVSMPCATSCIIITADFEKNKDPIKEAISSDCATVKFPKMNKNHAIEYLNNILFKEIKSDASALDMIVETAGTSIAALDNEAEKIKAYMYGSGKSIFKEEDAAEICGFSKKLPPYFLGSYLASKNQPAAMNAADIMFEQGEDPLKMLAIIYGCIEKLIKAKLDPKDPQKNDKQAFFYKAKAENFKEEHLAYMLKRCIISDSELKSSNKVSPKTIIKTLITQACKQDDRSE